MDGIFLNATELYYPTMAKFGRKIDYLKLVGFLSAECEAFIYGQFNNKVAHKFRTKLKSNGFNTRFFPTNRHIDLAANMIVDILNGDYENYYIGSTNVNLLPLINNLNERGKTVVLIGRSHSSIERIVAHTIDIEESMLEAAKDAV